MSLLAPILASMTSSLRIGTWNLQGRWDERHLGFIGQMNCDVLLLTEVSDRAEIPGMHGHATETYIARRRFWAAVCSREPLKEMPDPHGASAMAHVGGLTFTSSILPYRSCGDLAPWTGTTTFEKTQDAIDKILWSPPDVWGGDWNHTLSGPEHTGTKAGRMRLLGRLHELGLQVPTAELPRGIGNRLSTDHIAIPNSWNVVSAEHFEASHDGYRLSDHDAYVVDIVKAGFEELTNNNEEKVKILVKP